MPLSLRVNGQTHHLDLDSRTTLLDALREHIGLTGTKKGCDHGQCGACTVHVNGKTALACLTLAHAAADKDIKTIEGLAGREKLHPMQEAFVRHDAFQCGYCTPGQIMSAVEDENKSLAQVFGELGVGAIEEYGEYLPEGLEPSALADMYKGKFQAAGGPGEKSTMFAFGAEFVEVRVHRAPARFACRAWSAPLPPGAS